MKAGEIIKGAAMAKFEANIMTIEPSTNEVILASGKQTFLRL